MLKLRQFINYSVTDSIDQGRVNSLYFGMMKNLKFFNRLKDLESWLLSKNWSKNTSKRVQHTHILGNSCKMKMKKSSSVNRLAVIVPENENFEIMKEMEFSRVNKAIGYL
jgi:hypothetical protein